MSVPTVILERLTKACITEVAIIDDVFDGPADLDIKPHVGSFAENVQDDPDASVELERNYGVQPDDHLQPDVARKLCSDREKLGQALRKHVDLLLCDYDQRLQMVNQIKAHLMCLNIHVKCYGDAGLDPSNLPPESTRFILLDYVLTPDESGSRNAASIWCAKQLCSRANRPFLVLISNVSVSETEKDEYRRLSEQVGGTFAFVQKDEAIRAEILYLKIGAWVLAYPVHPFLQDFVNAVNRAMDDIVGQFRKTLRGFTVQDYAFIQRITLEEEGQPLGEYMLEFLAGLLSHEFRANRDIRAKRENLDRLSFEQYVASDAQPGTELAKMYGAALTDPVFSDVGPHPRDLSSHTPDNAEIAAKAHEIWETEGRPPDRATDHWFRAVEQLSAPLPLLALGDIFIKDAESCLWMVVNAACDLMFSPRSKTRQPRRKQPIYLIRGVFGDLHDSPDIETKEVTELFAFGDKAYRIIWDYRYVRSVPLEDFRQEVTAKGYIRKARLALPYALKIQRAWTAHLDRIGLPSPPPMFEEANVSVYASGTDNQWLRIEGPISGGAVLVRRKVGTGYQELCVLTMLGEAAVYRSLDEAIRRVDEELAGLRESPPTEAGQHRPAKISSAEKKRQKLVNLKEDVSWRLQLLENPRAISAKLTWIIERVLAVCLEGDVERASDKQAQLIIDVTRPTLKSV